MTQARLGQVRQLKRELIAQKVLVAQMVEDGEFGHKDALIAAIMPGGLIYAPYRKVSHKRTKAQLADVTSQMDDLSRDLLVLKAASGEIMVGMLS